MYILLECTIPPLCMMWNESKMLYSCTNLPSHFYVYALTFLIASSKELIIGLLGFEGLDLKSLKRLLHVSTMS
jgi:hypothetical protein